MPVSSSTTLFERKYCWIKSKLKSWIKFKFHIFKHRMCFRPNLISICKYMNLKIRHTYTRTDSLSHVTLVSGSRKKTTGMNRKRTSAKAAKVPCSVNSVSRTGNSLREMISRMQVHDRVNPLKNVYLIYTLQTDIQFRLIITWKKRFELVIILNKPFCNSNCICWREYTS